MLIAHFSKVVFDDGVGILNDHWCYQRLDSDTVIITMT
jgi:hypothetical protein